ncbi:MAG: protein kinase [Deltaproteobacteria bacterium]|nr:protein kinase [Deltaproteobacteria bacterium]MDQ3299428.1 protein kinase [Myxococcota bacterium]
MVYRVGDPRRGDEPPFDDDSDGDAPDRPTEHDLTAAAAAAVAASEELQQPDFEEGTVLSGPPNIAHTPAPPRPSAYAPTAIPATFTAGTPVGVPLAPVDELPEGTLLAGRYHITHFVGQGGMGTVYAAHDDDLDEDIAIKVLRPELACDVEFKRRLKAEVRLARRVSHPNVCRVHDFGIEGELVFVTMELVRGRTLRERLAEIRAGRGQPLELAHIVDIVLQIGSALSAAHRAGVIHRDVKPDNVILSDGRAVLTDFGVASMMVDRAQRPIVGTPAYLAPEMLRGEEFDHRVDVYAVSCLAYELIAGDPPFAASTMELALALARKRPAYPGLPEGFATSELRTVLDRVLARGLAADPNGRSPTIDRFTDAFAHAARTAPQSPAVSGRASGQISGSFTPADRGSLPALASKRNELRVTTTLVWYGDRTREAELAERIVVDAGGIPIRVVAGEIIALFGATRSTGDDADRAAHAAIDLVAKLGGHAGLDTARILLRPGDIALAGPESAATAVAIAQLAKEGEVLAGAATARQVAARFDVIETPTGARRVSTRRPHQRRGTMPIARRPVGPILESLRAEELAAIEGHLEHAFQARQPTFLEVRGQSGSGKTMLRKALVASVIARRDVEWLIALTSPVGEPGPLSVLQSASPEWYDATTHGGTVVAPGERDAGARRWLESRATRRPIVLLVDDLQWADPSSRALLDHLRATLRDVPVAIVSFARPDASVATPPGVHVVSLGPLDDSKAAQLATALAPAATSETIAQIVRRAAGNPFFIEELALEIAAGTSGASLPPTIEAVVQAHLDQLPETANHVAIAAAVIGHGFWRRAAARLVPALGDAELDAALAELERAGVIAAAPAMIVNDDYYQFTSTLVRDVAYARTPSRDRRQFHATIATWLDEQPRKAEQDATRLLAVAHHREHAGDTARAATTYHQAGKQCLEMFAYGEAVMALRKASALTTVPDPILDEELADALAQTDGYAAAEPVYQRALDETDDDDAPARARLLYKLGTCASKRGNSANAIGRFTAGLAIAAPGGKIAGWARMDPRTPALLWADLGWTLGYLLGQVDKGQPHCERAVALLEDTPHRRDLAHALSRLGGTYMRACRFADHLRCNQQNLEIAVELRDLNMQLTANVNLGVVHGVLGDLDAAVAVTLAARALALRTGAAARIGLTASNLAGFYLELGRLDEADALLDDAIEINERTGNRYILCESFTFRARIAAARDDLPAARVHAERSLALARSLAQQVDVAVAMRILAQLDSRAGDHDAARKLIDEALVVATQHDALEAIRTRAARSRILVSAGLADLAEIAALRTDLERLGTRRELAVLADLRQVR